VTEHACRRNFGPLSFSPKFIVTWLKLFEYAILVQFEKFRCRHAITSSLVQKSNPRFTPTILTIDDELIRLIFATHFGLFPTRVPVGQTFGNGPIFGHTLQLISDMPRWKRKVQSSPEINSKHWIKQNLNSNRLRSTLSPGFSTRQLNEMVIAISKSIGNASQFYFLLTKPYCQSLHQFQMILFRWNEKYTTFEFLKFHFRKFCGESWLLE